jgi:isochorismate synthase EntC
MTNFPTTTFRIPRAIKTLIVRKIAESLQNDAEIQAVLTAADLEPTPSVCQLAALSALIVILANEKGQRVGS